MIAGQFSFSQAQWTLSHKRFTARTRFHIQYVFLRSCTHPGNSSVQIGTTITHGAPHVHAIQHTFNPVDNCSLRLCLMSTVHGLSCWECKLYGRWKGEIPVIPTTGHEDWKQNQSTRQKHALFQGRGVRLSEVQPCGSALRRSLRVWSSRSRKEQKRSQKR